MKYQILHVLSLTLIFCFKFINLPCVSLLLSLFFLVSISLTSCPFNFFYNFYCYSITVVCIFSPSLHPTPAKATSLPSLHPFHWFCLCVLYITSWKLLSPRSPPHSPLTIVRLFLTSMSLVIFRLLFLLLIMFQLKVRSYGTSLNSWLISLSIMHSSSIHGVAKGLSFFLLSAA